MHSAATRKRKCVRHEYAEQKSADYVTYDDHGTVEWQNLGRRPGASEVSPTDIVHGDSTYV